METKKTLKLESQEPTSKNEPMIEMEDDEVSQHMTQSYSEISFKSNFSPDNSNPLNLDDFDTKLNITAIQRPDTLQCEQSTGSRYTSTLPPMGLLDLDGTVSVEGNMTHFVAENVETKIKLSSPVSKLTKIPNISNNAGGGSLNNTPNSTLYRQLLDPQLSSSNNLIETSFLNDLECEAQRMATSIDNLIENLSGILHSISSITADNVDVYKNAVTKISDAIDGNIKSMYTLMSKVEEAAQGMKGIECQAARIKEIKKLVDLFETFV